jgi:prevent-host-death family protein
MTTVKREGQVSKASQQTVSKSRFKAQALEYFRQVERSGKELVITDHGRPVLKVTPYVEKPADALKALRGTVLRYDEPLEPVDVESWEALR